MDKKDLIKIVLLLGLYGVVAPVLGFILWRQKKWQRPAFVLLSLMIPSGIFTAAEWGLTISHNLYRGHATGYHFYFVEIVAIALIISRALSDWRRFSFMPPGLWAYFLYCAFCFLSLISAPSPNFVMMAAFKAVKIALIFVAVYNFLRTEDDLHFLLQTWCAVIFWQLLVVLKMKYIDGIYQVPGTFYHQNSLSMFVTMFGMIFLAASLGPPHPRSNWYLGAFIACAIIQQTTLSRAGLAIFAAGTLFVTVSSLVQKFTRRGLIVLCTICTVGILGLALTLDTIIARFQDSYNESSGMTRTLLNQASRNMVRDYPLGIGWNNFALTINKPWPYGKLVDDWEREGGVTVDEYAPKGVVESLYYLHLAETGYQGLFGLVFFMGLFLLWNWRACRLYRHHFVGTVSLGLAVGCGFNYVHSVVERVLIQPRNMMLWFMLLAVTARIETWRRAEKRARATARRETAPTQIRHSARQPAAARS